MRVNLFKKKETEETKTEASKVEEVKEPELLNKKEETVNETDESVRYIEREITLSLLNEKLNYLTARLEALIEAISK